MPCSHAYTGTTKANIFAPYARLDLTEKFFPFKKRIYFPIKFSLAKGAKISAQISPDLNMQRWFFR